MKDIKIIIILFIIALHILSVPEAFAGRRDKAHEKFMQGKYEESYKYYNKGKAINKPKNRNYILYNMEAGDAAMYAGDYDAAIILLQEEKM
jgi:tetratricopeptide (TPR) repeat protein